MHNRKTKRGRVRCDGDDILRALEAADQLDADIRPGHSSTRAHVRHEFCRTDLPCWHDVVRPWSLVRAFRTPDGNIERDLGHWDEGCWYPDRTQPDLPWIRSDRPEPSPHTTSSEHDRQISMAVSEAYQIDLLAASHVHIDPLRLAVRHEFCEPGGACAERATPICVVTMTQINDEDRPIYRPPAFRRTRMPVHFVTPALAYDAGGVMAELDILDRSFLTEPGDEYVRLRDPSEVGEFARRPIDMPVTHVRLDAEGRLVRTYHEVHNGDLPYRF